MIVHSDIARRAKTMKIEKTFCTTREAADLLGISVGTTQLWVENGLLAAWKTPGGHRRVMRDSVDKLLRVKTKPPELIAPSLPEPLAIDTPPLKILVLEDDASLLRLYKTMLTQWPMSPQVITVDNGIEALLLLEREHPDLLITDLSMAGTDGFQMLRVLKTNSGHADMSIVVVSGLDATDIVAQGGIPEGIPVLPKPIPFAKLLAIGLSVEKAKQKTSALRNLK